MFLLFVGIIGSHAYICSITNHTGTYRHPMANKMSGRRESLCNRWSVSNLGDFVCQSQHKNINTDAQICRTDKWTFTMLVTNKDRRFKFCYTHIMGMDQDGACDHWLVTWPAFLLILITYS